MELARSSEMSCKNRFLGRINTLIADTKKEDFPIFKFTALKLWLKKTLKLMRMKPSLEIFEFIYCISKMAFVPISNETNPTKFPRFRVSISGKLFWKRSLVEAF